MCVSLLIFKMDYTAKSVVVKNFGDYDCLNIEKFELPQLNGKIEVKVEFCGMNFADLYTRQGLMPKQCPFILGMECSGIVHRIGDPENTSLKLGQHVICYDCNGGMYSNIIRVDPKKCYSLPNDISFQDGAALFVNYLTAYFTLFELGNLKPNHTILIKSCAGGVGWAATQLAKTINTSNSRVKIIGTASKGKEDMVKENGVEHVVSNDCFEEEITAVCPDGFDLIIETESIKYSEDAKLLKPLGRIVLLGANNLIQNEKRISTFSLLKAWWYTKDVSLTSLILNNQSVSGLHLGVLAEKDPTYVRNALQEIYTLFLNNKIKPKIDSIWGFDEIVDATKLLAERRNIGKVLLKVDC